MLYDFYEIVRKSGKKYFARKFYQLLRDVIDSLHENRLKRARKNSRFSQLFDSSERRLSCMPQLQEVTIS